MAVSSNFSFLAPNDERLARLGGLAERYFFQLNIAFARVDRLEAETARSRKLLNPLEFAAAAKASRGELVLQDSSDEPTSALLERIRAHRTAAPISALGRRKAA